MEVVRLSAVELSKDTGAPVVQADIPITGDDDAESLGSLDMMQALGVTAIPAAADKSGYSEGLVARNVNGSPGVILGGRDTRTADVIAQLSAGETCLHSTGPGMDSRVFCKDQVVAIIVGDDMIFSVDRGAGKIIANAFGNIFQISEDKGIELSSGSAGISIKGGNMAIYGNISLGGMTPVLALPVRGGPSPIGGVPSTRVFFGAG